MTEQTVENPYKIYQFDHIDPDTGQYYSEEMQDVTHEFSGPVGLLGELLYRSCSNLCASPDVPEFKGYSMFDIEIHCLVYRFIALNEAEPGEPHNYRIRAVYCI